MFREAYKFYKSRTSYKFLSNKKLYNMIKGETLFLKFLDQEVKNLETELLKDGKNVLMILTPFIMFF